MKKIFCIIMNIVTSIVTLIGLTIIIAYIFGIVPTIVSTGSMAPKLPIGSLCVINTKYPFEKLKVNDIIVYRIQKNRVIHRVNDIVDGKVRTKGDNNDYVDRIVIDEEKYYGKYLFSINELGYFTTRLQSPLGKSLFVTFIITIYVLTYLANYAVKKEKTNGNNR